MIAESGRLFNAMKTRLLGRKELPKKVEVIRKNVKPTLYFGCETYSTTERHRYKIIRIEIRFLLKTRG